MPTFEQIHSGPWEPLTVCDVCGDEANSEPGLRCGRVDEEDESAGPCPGIYRTVEDLRQP